MKETGIIFTSESVGAILDGRKTQTRRVIRPQCIYLEDFEDGLQQPCYQVPCGDGSELIFNRQIRVKCPYGQVGDRLWVRETFAKRPLPSGGEQILYKAQYHELVEMLDLDEFIERHGYPKLNISWKPSIHMFKKDSRITLEITEVRVERLQEITQEDALTEGIERYIPIDWPPEALERVRGMRLCKHAIVKGSRKYTCCNSPIQAFRELWDDLNTKRGYSWSSNPWVWVISFATGVRLK